MHWKLCRQHLKCFSFDPLPWVWHPIHQHALVWHLDKSHHDGQRGQTHASTGDLDKEPVSEFSWHWGCCDDWGCNLGWLTTGRWTGQRACLMCVCLHVRVCVSLHLIPYFCSQPLCLTPLSITFRTAVKEMRYFQCTSWNTAVHLKKFSCAFFHFY